MTTATELWTRACERLQKLLHPDVYGRWIAVIQPVGLEDHSLTLSVDNDFYQTWLEDNYLPLIQQALSAECDSDIKVQITVVAHVAVPAAPLPESSTPVMKAIQPDLFETAAGASASAEKRRSFRDRPLRPTKSEAALNSKFTFDSFVIGPSNSFAHAASLAVAQAPARAYNPLFIYGGVGLGKTHLMQAIGHHVLSTARATVCFVSSEALLNEYIDAIQNHRTAQFRKKYRSTDLLLIDDIHFLAGKNALQEEFFHTFNALYDSRKQIVMTSDRPASEIAGLEKRLVSRFEWGLVTELAPPDLETRIAILRNKLAQSQVELSDEFLQFIAENVKSNIRRLEGALVRTMSYASLTGQPLTLDTLKHLLRDTLEQEHQSELTFEAIQRAVAEHYDIRLADMASKRRPRSVAGPRQVAMYLCRRMTRSSLPDIANAFCKTHATVLHAYNTIQGRMDVDQDLRQTVEQIAQKLGK